VATGFGWLPVNRLKNDVTGLPLGFGAAGR
jgi:hypothetical protein